jgi:hypothetical protein
MDEQGGRKGKIPKFLDPLFHKTPYQRILQSPLISPQIKQSLTKQLASLNPFVLRKNMEEKIKKIFLTCSKPHPSSNDPSR